MKKLALTIALVCLASPLFPFTMEKGNFFYHYDLGIDYMRFLKFQLAAEEFEKAIVINPAERSTYILAGRAYLAAGDLAQAEEKLKKARELDENYRLAYKYLGQLFMLKGDYVRAELYLSKSIILYPDDYEAASWLREARQGAVAQRERESVEAKAKQAAEEAAQVELKKQKKKKKPSAEAAAPASGEAKPAEAAPAGETGTPAPPPMSEESGVIPGELPPLPPQ